MYNQSQAAKGAQYGSGHRHLHYRPAQRAAVNIYKMGSSYEMMVFAPGRIKENFNVQVKGNELHVSYTPPEGFPKSDWVLREYSRGGFLRIFNLDNSVDASNISAKYTDGVLQVTLPAIKGTEAEEKVVPIN